MGSLSLQRYLSYNPFNYNRLRACPTFQVPVNVPAPLEESNPNSPSEDTKTDSISYEAAADTLSRLHNACQLAFGNTDALKFEFIDPGPDCIQCILMISRPNGESKSYTTQPIFSSQYDAKICAASWAISMGAVNFILNGAPESPKAKNEVSLAPLGTPDSLRPCGEPHPPENDPSIEKIEKCCREWRAGRVKPYWISLTGSEPGRTHGSALQIELSQHSSGVYSTDTIYDSVFHAKQACAKLALEQGVLDFIKYGNGQTQPATGACEEDVKMEDTQAEPSSTTLFSLQSFYETLPQPFLEPVGNKTAAEINAPVWFNTAMQLAQGGKLSYAFVWITDGTPGLHGCLLRIEGPGQSRSYLVKARFPKRTDAKAAVCLQAMSQGLGNYLRAVAKEVGSKLTSAMRRVAYEHIFPAVLSECKKNKSSNHPRYDFKRDKGAYGCTMRVALSSSPSPEERREYSVPTEYRSQADAKVAVVFLAAQEGVIEFLRFRGETPPPGHVPFLDSARTAIRESNGHKRKERDTEEYQGEQKRRKPNEQGKNLRATGGVPLLQRKEEVLTCQLPHPLPPRPSFSRKNDQQVRFSLGMPPVSEFGGFEPMRGTAQAAYPLDHIRYGSRNEGDSAASISGGSRNPRFSDVATPPLPGPLILAQRGGPPLPSPSDARFRFQGGSGVPYPPYRSRPLPEGVHPQMLSGQVAASAVYFAPQYAYTPGSVGGGMQSDGTVPEQNQRAQYPSTHHVQRYEHSVHPSSHQPSQARIHRVSQSQSSSGATLQPPQLHCGRIGSAGPSSSSTSLRQSSDGRPALEKVPSLGAELPKGPNDNVSSWPQVPIYLSDHNSMTNGGRASKLLPASPENKEVTQDDTLGQRKRGKNYKQNRWKRNKKKREKIAASANVS